MYLGAFSSLLKTNDPLMAVDLLNQSLVVQCLDFQATHILVLALCPVTLFTLNLLKRQHIVTAHWFYEDFRAAYYWKDVISGYSYFFAIQKGPIVDECKKHKTTFMFLPTAAGMQQETGHLHDTGHDVAFVGIPSVYRISLLEHLVNSGIKPVIAGYGWNRYNGILVPYIVCGAWTEAAQAMRILYNTKIGINISVNNPQSDIENTHISPRVFDVMKAGCVLLTEEVPLIHEILPDCNFHTFSCLEDACDKITAILGSFEKELASINNNREIIEHKHLYRHRVKRIISACGGQFGVF
ncbi:MAG TPA: hypothetical protein DCO75_02570 [Fibrobacteres bacterium]|nr:hypothetical protein [Fibrobacterota bacterium]